MKFDYVSSFELALCRSLWPLRHSEQILGAVRLLSWNGDTFFSKEIAGHKD